MLAVPIVPMLAMGEGYARWLWSDNGPSDAVLVVVGGALLAADILIPVPSGPLLALLAARLGWPAAAAVGTVGLTLGGVAGYALARWGGRALVRRCVEPEELARWDQSLAANGPWLVLASRPAPVVAEAVALSAGLGRMPLRSFLLWLLVGNATTSVCFAALGQAAADNELLPLGVGVSIALPLLILRLARIRQPKKAPEDSDI